MDSIIFSRKQDPNMVNKDGQVHLIKIVRKVIIKIDLSIELEVRII